MAYGIGDGPKGGPRDENLATLLEAMAAGRKKARAEAAAGRAAAERARKELAMATVTAAAPYGNPGGTAGLAYDLSKAEYITTTDGLTTGGYAYTGPPKTVKIDADPALLEAVKGVVECDQGIAMKMKLADEFFDEHGAALVGLLEQLVGGVNIAAGSSGDGPSISKADYDGLARIESYLAGEAYGALPHCTPKKGAKIANVDAHTALIALRAIKTRHDTKVGLSPKVTGGGLGGSTFGSILGPGKAS